MFNRIDFENSKLQNARNQRSNCDLQKLALEVTIKANNFDYAYQWTWLGLPIIQLPQDIIAIQEIIWKTKPDIIIETGIAWGGSTVYYASLLQLIGKGKMIGVDQTLPQKNINEIMKYPFSNRIHLIEGQSTSKETIASIKKHLSNDDKVMVILDSNHSHDHVLNELKCYAPLVTKNQYLIVCATAVNNLPVHPKRARPWGPDKNPMTALIEYQKEDNRFITNEDIDNKLLITYMPGGYLICKG